MGRTTKHPRRRTTQRAHPKTKTTPTPRRDARVAIATDDGLAVLDNEFSHGDDWLEPYEPNEETP